MFLIRPVMLGILLKALSKSAKGLIDALIEYSLACRCALVWSSEIRFGQSLKDYADSFIPASLGAKFESCW